VPDETTPVGLMAQAVSRALAEDLGLRPAVFDGTNIGGSSVMAHLAHAHAALEAGLCSVAVIACGSSQRSVSRAAAAPREVNPWATPCRPVLPARPMRWPPRATGISAAPPANRWPKWRSPRGAGRS
jgi:acetyl-CoA acetyltransferase